MPRALLALVLLSVLAACSGHAAPPVYDGPGRDRLGLELAPLLPARRLGPTAEVAGHVTLVRWWTEGCPYCERSLPSLEELRLRYAPRGLAALAVYHPKPPRAVSDEEVHAAAERLGWHGALAVDEDWSVLNKAWLDSGPREATSVSFLLDRRGRVRWVHPGPELHASEDPEHAACARDYAALAQAIEGLLAEE